MKRKSAVVCSVLAVLTSFSAAYGTGGVRVPSGDMQVENDPCIGFLRPAEKALVVPLDQSDRAIDDIDIVLSEILAHVSHEGGERISRHE